MSDLGLYHRNRELEAQVASLKADLRKSERRAATAELEAQQVPELKKRIRLETQAKSKYKRIAEKHKPPTEPSRCDIALELIARREAGTLAIKLTEIAEQCLLGYSTVKTLARDYRKQLKPS